MIDRIIIPSSVHVAVGMLVLTLTLAAAVLTFWHAWRKQPHARWIDAVLIGTQLVLMAQVLIGIKLLDQGAGVLQLYIHYVGGLAPMLFFLVLYWFPLRDTNKQRWALSAATGSAFVFALMAFVIGQSYVRGVL